jgi:GNAT superfamily N-acetyltransferase
MIRRATEADAHVIAELVHGLADYEKLGDECAVTGQQLRAALFGPNPAVFAHVAELDGDVVGIAIWFLTFSTFRGAHGIWLEDLFVTPKARGRGLGKALLAALAREAVTNGYARVEWSVLNWNTPSIAFYNSLGACPLPDWNIYRLTGDALREMCE